MLFKKNLKGGVSQIIIATILTPFIIFLFLNLTVAVLHVYTRTNINQIAQESVNDIARLGSVTEALNMQYKTEIDKYKPILKNYEIKYTFSEYNTSTKKFEPMVTMINNVDSKMLKSLNAQNLIKATVTINQTDISTLQNIQNLSTGSAEKSYISVEKSMIISNLSSKKVGA